LVANDTRTAIRVAKVNAVAIRHVGMGEWIAAMNGFGNGIP
jgi:hypothetical protein